MSDRNRNRIIPEGVGDRIINRDRNRIEIELELEIVTVWGS
jgi:hypothetical protein